MKKNQKKKKSEINHTLMVTLKSGKLVERIYTNSDKTTEIVVTAIMPYKGEFIGE